MNIRGQWAGIKLLKTEFKPRLYAKRDQFGKYTALDGRAQATLEYLAEEQWKSKPGTVFIDVTETVQTDLKQRREKETKPNIKDGPITEDELDAIIRKMSREKAPGPDNITTDWLKDLDDENRKWLLAMLNSWWESGTLPEEMSEARVASIKKKGDPSKQDNYRPISLLNKFYKVLAAAIKMRLEQGLEERITGTQFGFREGKSTTQAMYIARRIQEYAERAGLPRTMIFLDWEKAFDKIKHNRLLEVLDSYQVPRNLTNLIASLYKKPIF